MRATPRARRTVVRCAVVTLLTALSGSALAACSTSEQDAPEAGSWTVLHYSVADNDLEEPMVQDVDELGSVGSRGSLTVREFLDRSPGYTDAEVLDQGDFDGARVLDLGEPGTSTLVDDLGDVDSSDPATLASFLADGLEAHPADHYALVISDHGGQWSGIGLDETSGGGLLTLPDLVEGIGDGLEQAGVERLDLLGFDACLMAGYEVAAAMAPFADRMVASQELEPGHGWDYSAFEVAADGATPDELGRAIIDGFREQATAQETVSGVTLALLDLTRLQPLTEAVSAFGDTLSDDPRVVPAVGRAQAQVIGFGRNPDPEQDAHLSDLGELVAAVGKESDDASAAADRVQQALDDVVVEEFAGEARAGATGLSIYLPPSVDYFSADYAKAVSTPWIGFLRSFYGLAEQAAQDVLPTFVQDEPDATIDADGLTLTADYDPAGQDALTRATISYARVERDGTITYLGEESADYGTADEPTAVGTYDFTTLRMSDGEDAVDAYTDLTVQDDGYATFQVPLDYYAPDAEDDADPTDVLLKLVVDPDAGEIVSETYYVYDPETSAYGEGELDPEGIIAPKQPNYDAEGTETWVSTSDVGLYADLESITYDFVPLRKGTRLQVDLSLYDAAGNVASSSTEVRAP
ncbi:hypothetical protein K8Z61_09520 [Nocardioides sp. TRM66260-LWL]|uniref:clostripain-related cysteine peptidase n=1 Tax=Nocardioides sp. TRM66260-LWL TaxID=2874478 RepID=UPI001CC5BFC2|nr:clostripain-related cysteine peptidase [Nocardioides sp. TRM66260-LWL]MBZ5734734.1 hypothetical protein [Nocardioides sp. TRM66260-LWL]